MITTDCTSVKLYMFNSWKQRNFTKAFCLMSKQQIALQVTGGCDTHLWGGKQSCPQQWQDQGANHGFQEESSPSTTSVDKRHQGQRLQVSWLAHQQPELVRKHPVIVNKAQQQLCSIRSPEESWPESAASYRDLQRSCGERPHQRYHCVVWKHHTWREEGLPKDY